MINKKVLIIVVSVLFLALSFASAKSFTIFNSSNESQPYFSVNGTTGNVGIGITAPTTLLQILNNNWISAKNYFGTGTVNMFKVNTNDQIEVGATLNIGTFEFTEDSGLVTFVDMPVSSTPTAGTPESYVFRVDGENIMTVYSEANGAGAVQNKRVGIGTLNPFQALHVNGSAIINGTLNMDSNRITNLANASSAYDAVTLAQLQAVNASAAIESDPYWTANYTAFNATWSNTTNMSYVPYTGANKNVVLGNNNFSVNDTTLFVDTNKSRVGIGTSSPSQALDIAGKIYASGNFKFNDTNESILVGTDTGNTLFATTALGLMAAYNNNGSYVTAVGDSAGDTNKGDRLTAVGYIAGYYNTGYYLTATGYQSGAYNAGDYVTATGPFAGAGSDVGSSNTGDYLTATGFQSGAFNKGDYVTATGAFAGAGNGLSGIFNTGNYTTVMGYAAGYNNKGPSLTAIGYAAGYDNNGSYVTAVGYNASQSNRGNYSSGFGYQTLMNNLGNNVVAIGYQAGLNNVVNNQFIVQQANVNPIPLIQGNFSSGNVGIGTIEPQQKLHVNGSILANGTINATTDVCIEGGNCLSNISLIASGEALWTQNYSAFNATWSNTTNMSYVPYNGANQNVNLGNNKLDVNGWTNLSNTTIRGLTITGDIDVGDTYGSNLIPSASSNFNTDGTGWWSIGGGPGRNWNSTGFMNVSGGGSTYFYLYTYSSGIVTGKTYRVSIKLRSNTYSSSLFVYGNDVSGAFYTGNVNSTWQTFTGNMIPIVAGGALYIQSTSPFNGDLEIDDIIIQELIPGSTAVPILNISNGKLYVSYAGNVGIGTITPLQKLHVNGSAIINGTLNMDSNRIVNLANATTLTDAVTLAQLQNVNTSFTTGYVPYVGANKNVVLGNNNFSVNDTTLFVDTNNSRVGIGTTSPTAALSIIGNQTIGSTLRPWGSGYNVLQMGQGLSLLAGTTSDVSEFESNVYWNGASYVLANNGPASKMGFGAGQFDIATTTSGNAGDLVVMTSRFTVLNNGNVGIGTTSPLQKLHVNGSAIINGTLNMDSNKIINLSNGTDATDAVTFSQLQAVSSVASGEPLWTANYTAFNNTWSNTYNDTTNISIVNHINLNNASINNYILANNQSVNTYVNLTNTSMRNYVDDTFLKQGNESELNVNDSQYLDGHDSSFFMPLNQSVYGEFNFNGGWTSNGVTIKDGNIYAQAGYFYNISSISVSNLNINGSLYPYQGYDAQFDIGNSTLRWRDLYLSGQVNVPTANITNTLYVGGVNISQRIAENNDSVNNYINATNTSMKNYVDTRGFGTGNGTINGTGTAWYIPMWNGTNTLNNSLIYQNGKSIGINTTNPRGTLHVDSPTGLAFVMTGTSYDGTGGDSSNGAAFVLSHNSAGNRQFAIGDTETGASVRIIGNSLDGYNYTGNYRMNLSLGTDTSDILFQGGIWKGGTGNVGIGTITPFSTTRLHVNGNILANGTINATTDVCIEGGTCLSNVGTNGSYVPYLGANKNVVLGNNNFSVNGTTLFVDTNNSRVGIGTTSPTYPLSVVTTGKYVFKAQGTAGDINNPSFDFYDTTNGVEVVIAPNGARGVIGTWSNQPFGLITNKLERLSVDASGKVGINTTVPNRTLQVVGDALINGTINATTDVCIEGGICLSNVGTNGSYVPYVGANKNVVLGNNNFSVNDTTLFVDTNNSRVGIGTTSPEAMLHIVTTGVANNIKLDSTGASSVTGLSLATDGAIKGYWAVARASGNYFTDAAVGDMAFRSESNNILFGQGSGQSTMAVVGSNVGIGTTSPNYTLHIVSTNNMPMFVTSNATTTRMGIDNTYTDPNSGLGLYTGGLLKWSLATVQYPGTGTAKDFVFYNDQQGVASLYIDGNNSNVGIGTTTPFQTLHVNGSILANGTINATVDLCIQGGVCLSNVSASLANGTTSGTGTPGYIPMWNSTTSFNNSNIYQNDSKIGINTTNPKNTLNVVGDANVTGSIIFGSTNMTTKANGDVNIW